MSREYLELNKEDISRWMEEKKIRLLVLEPRTALVEQDLGKERLKIFSSFHTILVTANIS